MDPEPEKRRHSLSFSLNFEPSISSVSPIRSSSRSPSLRRLSLRRSSRDSTRSSTPSVDHEVPLSCVTRDTSRDDCAFHRFMVWVAVKRNACPRMTPNERLECPMLRCRKRFINHEVMLRHLYACEELESGEYWCYDCEKVERFTDKKCKRCLGQPTKRRKILSMAKTFFTSLGHKSRRDGLQPLAEDEIMLPPPSYDSLDLTNELCSTNEIHEIDSTEISPIVARVHVPSLRQKAAPPAAAPVHEAEPSSLLPTVMYPPGPSCVFPAELENTLPLPDGSGNTVASWIDASVAYHATPGHDPVPLDRRPVSVISRHSAEEGRAKTRTKDLGPSLSVRSTASNSSTNSAATTVFSTVSNDSTDTACTGISHSWNDTWPVTPGLDTDLDSPASGLLYPTKIEDTDLHVACFDDGLDGDIFMQEIMPELPACLPSFTPDLPRPQPPNGLPGSLPFEHQAAAHIVPDNMPLLGDASSFSQATTPAPELPSHPLVEPTSLVASVWETLLAHVSSTEQKLRPLASMNNLASHFLALQPRSVATVGHTALRTILQGGVPESLLDLLCYLHVGYSYSLVVHEESATMHSENLFAQALGYANLFGKAAQTEYLDVIRAIWQPDSLSSTPSEPSSSNQDRGSGKGKEPATGAAQRYRQRGDAFLAVAQYLLDELEHSVLPGNSPRGLEAMVSDLWATHIQEASPLSAVADPAFGIAIGSVINSISQEFSSGPGLTAALLDVDQRAMGGSILTVRRVELELLQAAHGFIPLTTLVNDYAPYVRGQCDTLYGRQMPGSPSRPVYYGQVINTIESIISGFEPVADSGETNDIESFFKSLVEPSTEDELQALLEYSSPDKDMAFLDLLDIPATHEAPEPAEGSPGDSPFSVTAVNTPDLSDTQRQQRRKRQQQPQTDEHKVEAPAGCHLCGYRPKGNPRWFEGSMAKHMRNQHSTAPPTIYECPYPGCKSKYKNRPDNLRQHQIDKGHFVEGFDAGRRPSKKRKME